MEPNERDGRQRGLNIFTVFVLFVAVLGGMLFGLDISTAAITSMNTFRSDMGIPLLVPTVKDSTETTNQITLFTVLFHVSTMIGAPISGYISDRVGRKRVINIGCTIFMSGAIWQACAGLLSVSFAWTSILLGRMLGGIGLGFILTVVPVYAAELSPSRYRGKVITLYQFNIVLGIFLGSLINQFVKDISWGWRLGFAVQSIPSAIIILLALFVLPESPRSLIKRGYEADARLALRRLTCSQWTNRTSVHNCNKQDIDPMIDYEVENILLELAALKKAESSSFFDLFRGTALPSFLCGFFIALGQNITGITWFLNYATQLFNNLGFDAFVMDLSIKCTLLGVTIIALFFIDSFGRKFLMVWGTIGIILIFLINALVVVADTTSKDDSGTQSVQMFTLVMIFLFVAVYASGWGYLGWLIPAEVFPIHIRAKGMSTAVFANMLTNIVLGDYGYVSLYAATSVSTAMFVLVALNVLFVLPAVVFLLPETKRVALENMNHIFAYVLGGNPNLGHGTMTDFFKANAYETKCILLCRGVIARRPNAVLSGV
mmetsp:Transcript_31694/g.50623  ORF Transcript_31694/g.50623 Transcript_31694/m.50623 type:complete len:545 (-) Transcript_31694:135-1769(-)|eukprot:CAMPEP_0203762068 /NCGR_PEP_ID=MMETSP0098-20131031/15026_1 /ASSEMBLY_ACC=CAM_ASM_000208 /TAXON_ID=96639 /ORGANISM=" , Strain NY0313808BC1" /LENGTH=544 /DNA_ID=CAMNT_0050656325 /DNA_START=130 /DNA_END=1764 /DNA_ORIENTATION=-